jgi:DNA-binding GntR family transcriptional regulator
MPARADIEGWDGALNELIAARHGVRAGRIVQDIAAVALGNTEARLLNAAPRSPALKTQRRYRAADGHIFQASVSLHPGDRFVYSMQLDRA